MTDTILVTGATGKTGRRLVPLLRSKNFIVRAASRRPEKEHIAFDWHDASTHDAALAGADAIYLIPPEFVEDPTPIIEPFLTKASIADVRRIVLLSSMGAGFPREPAQSGRRKLERLVHESGLDATTVLRASGFMQNFSEGFLLPAIRNGGIPNPAGNGRAAMVDAGDIAAVAAAILADPSTHGGKTHDITGPAPIGFADAAQIIANVAGRPVAVHPMESSQFLGMLESVGLPTDYAAMLLRDQESVRDGLAAGVNETVERITGMPPVDFASYAAGAAAAWRD
jgi:uncharacterized protein YbjT (DUF2867 family)